MPFPHYSCYEKGVPKMNFMLGVHSCNEHHSEFICVIKQGYFLSIFYRKKSIFYNIY